MRCQVLFRHFFSENAMADTPQLRRSGRATARPDYAALMQQLGSDSEDSDDGDFVPGKTQLSDAEDDVPDAADDDDGSCSGEDEVCSGDEEVAGATKASKPKTSKPKDTTGSTGNKSGSKDSGSKSGSKDGGSSKRSKLDDTRL